jgi:hypothetical protein
LRADQEAAERQEHERLRPILEACERDRKLKRAINNESTSLGKRTRDLKRGCKPVSFVKVRYDPTTVPRSSSGPTKVGFDLESSSVFSLKVGSLRDHLCGLVGL